MGDATTNYVELPASGFTALVNGGKYTFEGYARATKANCKLIVSIGTQSYQSEILSTTLGSFTKLFWNFVATAGEVSVPVKIFLDTVDIVYLDLVSIKETVQCIPTIINNWFKILSGSSLVNHDSIEKHLGTFCARFDIDSSANAVSIYQDVVLELNKKYTVETWIKSDVAVTNGVITNIKRTSDSYYLQTNAGIFNTTADAIKFSTTTSWVKTVTNFLCPTAGTYRFEIKSNGGASRKIYIDTTSITEAYDYTLMAWSKKKSGKASEYSISANANNLTYVNASNGFQFASNAGGTDALAVTVTDVAKTPLDGKYNLMVGTIDRVGNAVLYKNGEAVGTSTSAKTVGKNITGANLYINNFSPSNLYQGETQIVRGRALLQSEIQSIVNAGNNFPTTYATGEVVAHYKWVSGTEVNDSSAKLNHLTAVATPTYVNVDFMLQNWTKEIIDQSMVVVETTDVRVTGGKAVMFQIDAASSTVKLYQTTQSLTAGLDYTFYIYAKSEPGLSGFQFILKSTDDKYLQDDYSFSVIVNAITYTFDSRRYIKKLINFTAPTTGTYYLELANLTSVYPSTQVYFDRLSLKEFPNGLHGTMENNMDVAQPIYPSSFILDGVDDYGDFGDVLDVAENSFIAFSWVKVASSANTYSLWDKVDNINSGGWSFYIDAHVLKSKYFTTDGNNALVGTHVVDDGEWHLVAFVVNKTLNRNFVYVDFDQDSVAITGTFQSTTTINLLFGAMENSLGGNFFNGQFGISGICIFDGQDGALSTMPNYEKIIRDLYYNTKGYYI